MNPRKGAETVGGRAEGDGGLQETYQSHESP
jgi:hypothetical protein